MATTLDALTACVSDVLGDLIATAPEPVREALQVGHSAAQVLCGLTTHVPYPPAQARLLLANLAGHPDTATPRWDLLNWALRALAVGREEDVAYVLFDTVDAAMAASLQAALAARYRRPAQETSMPLAS